MIKVLLRGYYGYKNSGDDALFYTIVQKLSVQTNVLVTTLSKGTLEYPEDTYVEFKNPSIKNILKGILKSDVIVFGGGSQLQDYGKMRLQLSILKTYTMISLMKMLNRRVVYLGVSIGPLETSLGKVLGKLILKKTDFIVVRDQSSFDYLKKEKINQKKIRLVPDLAINLIDSINTRNIRKNGSKKMILGVNLLPFFGTVKNDKDKENRLVETVANSINKIVEENNNIEIRLFSFQEDEELNDYDILKSLNEKLTSPATIIRYQPNPIYVLEEVSKCDRFAGMRLHSSIFSYASEVPQLILSYHPKCKGFGESVGYRAENVVDTATLSSDTFTAKLRELIEQPEAFNPAIPVSASKNDINEMYNELVNNFIETGKRG